ncbi:hypothetical protein H4R18_004280 [Coemansia javaensis]|uniref:GTP-binding protein n=1 Tax=Coemansia javaensis TaxID=2761396 RepID=A0A9W8H6K8_9FUNG|nr:hypothetical protein H4R18_004280 [Coemansia javaensis]
MNGYGAAAAAPASLGGMYGSTGPTATETGSDTADHGGARHEREQLAERRVLLMGLPRSGKTSMIKVVLENELAYDTLVLLPTQQRTAYRMLAGITVYDFPGIDDYSDSQYNTVSPEVYEGDTTALVFVIDSQGDIQSAIATLFSVIRAAQSVNLLIPINVMINKVDGLSEELKQDIQHDIQQRVLKNMSIENLDPSHVSFMLTTIYGESIREAFSKVIQRLVPQHSSLETILNSFCSKSSLDKVFLFDKATKVYLSTDSSPTFSPRYAFACKTIDVVEEISSLCAPYMPAASAAAAAAAGGGGGTGGGGSSAADDDGALLQRVNVGLDGGYDEVFMYQVSHALLLFCFGSPRIINQTSLLEFNGSKVAKAIRKILSA